MSWDLFAAFHTIVENKMWPGVCPICQPQEHEQWHRHEKFQADSCRCSIVDKYHSSRELVYDLIEEIHDLKKKCKHTKPENCDCDKKCLDLINCKKCQIVNYLRIDIGLEPLK
jgi:hypothetical protein